MVVFLWFFVGGALALLVAFFSFFLFALNPFKQFFFFFFFFFCLLSSVFNSFLRKVWSGLVWSGLVWFWFGLIWSGVYVIASTLEGGLERGCAWGFSYAIHIRE